MNFKPIIIVAGEPNSIFFEIFFKAIKSKNYKSPLLLICCKKLISQEMKRYKLRKKIRIFLFSITGLRKIRRSMRNFSIQVVIYHRFPGGVFDLYCEISSFFLSGRQYRSPLNAPVTNRYKKNPEQQISPLETAQIIPRAI